MKYKIINPNKKEIPWQEKPKGNNTPVWRYAANPIFKRNLSVFFEGKPRLVFPVYISGKAMTGFTGI